MKASGTRWILPFPRLRFRLRHGYWCEHPAMSPWHMIDVGRCKLRRCPGCDYTEVT